MRQRRGILQLTDKQPEEETPPSFYPPDCLFFYLDVFAATSLRLKLVPNSHFLPLKVLCTIKLQFQLSPPSISEIETLRDSQRFSGLIVKAQSP